MNDFTLNKLASFFKPLLPMITNQKYMINGRMVDSMSKIIIGFLLIMIFNSCKKQNETNFWLEPSVVVIQPYSDLICHPDGKVVGFNHSPLIEIAYKYDSNSPSSAIYKYDSENSGFWIMNLDGSNPHRVLSHYLFNPDWSPDGKWITFSLGGNIFKMEFNGEKFDTNSIVQLTIGNHNYNPTWSPDGKKISYHNTDCGTSVEPIPENSCGVLIMDYTGNNKILIKQARRFPFWINVDTLCYYGMYYFDLKNNFETKFFDNVANNLTLWSCPSFNSKRNRIIFLAKSNVKPGPLYLYSIEKTGKNLNRISTDPVLEFSCAPDGKIIFLLYDSYRIDNKHGTLWIMDEKNQNKKQLTYNNYNVTYY